MSNEDSDEPVIQGRLLFIWRSFVSSPTHLAPSELWSNWLQKSFCMFHCVSTKLHHQREVSRAEIFQVKRNLNLWTTEAVKQTYAGIDLSSSITPGPFQCCAARNSSAQTPVIWNKDTEIVMFYQVGAFPKSREYSLFKVCTFPLTKEFRLKGIVIPMDFFSGHEYAWIIPSVLPVSWNSVFVHFLIERNAYITEDECDTCCNLLFKTLAWLN